MAGTYPYLQHGPTTYEVNVTVTGGQLVEPDSTTGKVKPATAASTTVLGVALADGAPAGSGSNLAFGTNRPTIAVGRNCDIPVTYAADCPFGAKLVAAASGQVTPIVVAGGSYAVADITASRSIIGQCTEPGGVVSGATKRAWIY